MKAKEKGRRRKERKESTRKGKGRKRKRKGKEKKRERIMSFELVFKLNKKYMIITSFKLFLHTVASTVTDRAHLWLDFQQISKIMSIHSRPQRKL